MLWLLFFHCLFLHGYYSSGAYSKIYCTLFLILWVVNQAHITSSHHKLTSQAHITSLHHKFTSQTHNTSSHHKLTSQAHNTSSHHKFTSQAHNTSSHHKLKLTSQARMLPLESTPLIYNLNITFHFLLAFKTSPPPVLNKVIAFLLKVHHLFTQWSTCGHVRQEALKEHWRCSTVQEEGLTNDGRHHLLVLHKPAHDNEGIADSLHMNIYRTEARAHKNGRLE